jgi:hypothetical protein
MSEPILNTADAVAALGALPMPVGPQPQIAEVFVPRTERSYWEDIAAALNAAAAVGMPVGIDLDGTLTDRHMWSVVWDRSTERWSVAGYEDAEPYVSRVLPPRDAVCARPECGHRGEDHHHGDTKCWAHLPRTRGAFGVMSPIEICGCSGFVEAPSVEESADRLTGFFAPVAALREDDPNGLHHTYLVGRDLPEGTGGAR